MAGKWSYSIAYDTASCGSCPNTVDILFQVSTSRNAQRDAALPKFSSWVSVPPGKSTADLSKSPLVVSARFDLPSGRVGGLDVEAQIVDESDNARSIVLYDTGSIGETAPSAIYFKFIKLTLFHR